MTTTLQRETNEHSTGTLHRGSPPPRWSDQIHLILIACLFCLLTALPPAARALPARLSDQARISVLTITPGRAVYSMFGHNAIRVYDPARRLDVVFNYGTFAYQNIYLFALQFSYGSTPYSLSIDSFEHSTRIYRDVERRSTIEQVLDLSPADRDAVYAVLLNSYRPENRSYRYDPVYENCSTKVRDVLIRALGGRLSLPGPEPYGRTYRELLDRYGRSYPGFDMGYDLLTGSGLDREATAYEAMFLPFELAEGFEKATLRRGGRMVPLVASRDTLLAPREVPYHQRAFPWPAVLMGLFFAGALALTIHDSRTRTAGPRLFDRVLFGVTGILGLVLCYLWFISQNEISDTNWNLAWALPTHLPVAFLLSRSVRLRPYFAATTVLCVLLLVGWPFLPQALNPAFFPMVLTLALRAGRLAFPVDLANQAERHERQHQHPEHEHTP